MKKLVSIVLALALVALSIGAAVADKTSEHTITIENTDQHVSHTYTAYQVFKGDADAAGTKLANIEWGDGVDAAAIISAISNSTDASLASLKTAISGVEQAAAAAKLAEALSSFSDTSAETAASGALDAFGDIVAAHTKGTGAAFTENSAKYSTTVTGDGYYIIKDSTATLKSDEGSDTKSKNILVPVLKNTKVVAKDTHLTPDKEIVKGNETVEEDSAAVGDTVTFQVTIAVPNTRKYVNKFIFDMVDTLPKGLTFNGITSVKVGSANVTYDLYIDGVKQASPFSAPTDPVDANAPENAQTIKLDFTNFKSEAENSNPVWFGQDLVVTYTAIVNKNADFTPSGNINKVKFDYSNDPNHNYDGTEPNPPMGETPEDDTKTVLANIDVYKTDGTNALAGAEFEISSEDYNVTLVTGEKFEKNPYTLEDGEEKVSDGWYLLKDGTYTQTAPNDDNGSAYQSKTETYTKVSFADFVTRPGTTKKVTVISGENGHITLKGVKPGTYKIKETKAPSGFNLDPTEHTIVISANYNASSQTITLSGTVDGSDEGWDGTTATAEIEIENKSGTTLPSTGGIGTTIFYILGGLLVIGAAVILVARRKAQD